MAKFLLVFLLFLDINTHAQCGYPEIRKELPHITTDRYNHTFNTNVLSQHFLQIETCTFLSPEYMQNNQWRINDSLAKDNLYSNIKVRYGITNKIELQLGYSDIIINADKTILDYNRSNINSMISIGCKYNLIQNTISNTNISLYGRMILPKSAKFKQTLLSPEFRLLMSQDLNKRIRLTINIGTLYCLATQKMTYIYSVTANFMLHRDINVFTEIYKNNSILGSISFPNTRWLIGLNYYIFPNLLIYSSMESGWTKGNLDNSRRIDFGLTIRLPRYVYKYKYKHKNHFDKH